LKLALTSIKELDREERNPKDHKDKLDVFSVSFAHYTTQAATYRRYIYDSKKLAKLEKSDKKLENVRRKIDSWFHFNKEYPENLQWDELFPDDVFSTPAEVTGVSDSVFATGDMGTQIESEDFVSVNSDNMDETDQTQQQSAIDSVTAPVQSSNSNEADDSRMSVEPSTSKNTNSDTAAPGDVSESNNEDSVSDSCTVVKSKESSVVGKFTA
jgi:hypothetical protein